MLDIKWIRDNQVSFLKGLTDRGFDDPRATLTRLLSLDEERRGFLDCIGRLDHAAAGIERQHDRDRRHRLLEGIHLLGDAIFEDDEIAERQIHELTVLVGGSELERRPDRRRRRGEVACARPDAM